MCMNRIAVVYWSGTGNTQAMAETVAKGSGGTLFTADGFSPEQVDLFDVIAFGCPSMGAEQLEESEFEPMFAACRPLLKNKKLALFGSYGWGDGEWMRNWEEDCRSVGAILVCESVICQEAPDEDVLERCKKMGEALK